MLDYFKIQYEKQVVAAQRTPKVMVQFSSEARERGIIIIIAGAGGAAHFQSMVA
ncbi:phosphoribosylaminoimidazole carboxylase, partial [Staphylococcus aureus]